MLKKLKLLIKRGLRRLDIWKGRLLGKINNYQSVILLAILIVLIMG